MIQVQMPDRLNTQVPCSGQEGLPESKERTNCRARRQPCTAARPLTLLQVSHPMLLRGPHRPHCFLWLS